MQNKTRLRIMLFVWIMVSLACKTLAAPTPKPEDITAIIDSEFTLAPAQKAVLTDAGLSIQLIGVGGDQRCPSEIECAASGPVSISLFVQSADGTAIQMDLQTFTGNDGRTPQMQFEGINSQAEYEGYIIRLAGVLPYPAKSFDEIKDSDYRVSFIVAEK